VYFWSHHILTCVVEEVVAGSYRERSLYAAVPIAYAS
jgi:hypothetical protein